MNHDDIRLLDLMSTQYTQHMVPLQRLSLGVVPDVMDYVWDLIRNIIFYKPGTHISDCNYRSIYGRISSVANLCQCVLVSNASYLTYNITDAAYLYDPCSSSFYGTFVVTAAAAALYMAQHKKASNHHANLPLEMYSFTL